MLLALVAAGCMRVGGDDEDRAPGVPDGQGGAIAGVDGGGGLERRPGSAADGPEEKKDERARPGEKGATSASPSTGGDATDGEEAPGKPGGGHGPGQSSGPGKPAEPPTGGEPTPEPPGPSPEDPAEPTPPAPGGEPSPGPSAF